MKTILKNMTKKKVLVGSVLGIITGLILVSIKNFGICRSLYSGFGPIECARATQEDVVIFIMLISVPLFIGTLLLFFVHDEIFNLWFKFARIGLPICALIVLSASSYGSFFVSDRSITFGILSALFLFISFILVIYKLIQTRRNHK